jgi:two-component sensor histidine kinase
MARAALAEQRLAGSSQWHAGGHAALSAMLGVNMVNELVTNAVKYAFPGNTTGTVLVTLKRVSGELRLTVADNGQGIDFRRTDSGLGGRLVEGFAQQLGGQLKRESGNNGTVVCLTLPSREASYDLRA